MAITETKDKTTVPTHHQRPTWRCLITKNKIRRIKQNETAIPASPIQRGITNFTTRGIKPPGKRLTKP